MNKFTLPVTKQLNKRLRREPNLQARHLRNDVLPALFFGDLSNAPLVTIGMYPSEATVKDRLESLTSLGATSRETLNAKQCAKAVESMTGYFRQEGSRRSYFARLDTFLSRTGYMYHRGIAAHLNLIQEHISGEWGDLEKIAPEAAGQLRRDDIPFARWLVETVPFKVIVCDGKSASDQVLSWTKMRETLHAGKESLGKEAQGRFHWWIERATIGDRNVVLMGWNYVSSRANVKNIPWDRLGSQLSTYIARERILPPQPSYAEEMRRRREERFQEFMKGF